MFSVRNCKFMVINMMGFTELLSKLNACLHRGKYSCLCIWGKEIQAAFFPTLKPSQIGQRPGSP